MNVKSLQKDSELNELVNISRHFGSDNKYVIAGGGNTSFKDKDSIWIKASGVSLDRIDSDGFVHLSRKKLKEIAENNYPEDNNEREKLIKDALISSIITSEPVYYRRCIPPVRQDANSKSSSSLRPSVETSLHDIFDHPFVVHTHPTLVNALLCSQQAKEKTEELFGDDVLFIEYTDPGFILYKKTEERLNKFRKEKKHEPSVIFLQNHGLIVGGRNKEEIIELSERVLSTIAYSIKDTVPDTTHAEIVPGELPEDYKRVCKNNGLVIKGINSKLIQYYTSEKTRFKEVSRPFTPDDIVYCKSFYLFIGDASDDVESEINKFNKIYGYYPKIIGLENIGLLACAETTQEVDIALEIFTNMMKVSYLSMNFGGPKFLSEKEMDFIDNWESENYRRNLSKG